MNRFSSISHAARFTAALILSAQLGCHSTKGPAQPSADPCGDFEVEVERFWSASVKAKVMSYGGEASASRTQGLRNKMDRITEDWVMLRTSTCRDHFTRGLLSAAEYRDKVACFDAQLAKQRTLASLLSDGNLTDAEVELDTLLEEPAPCR
jgi:hypothetical protein